MLSEIIFASVPLRKDVSRPTGISGSSLFPCPHRLYKVQIGQGYQEDPTPLQILNMNDGWGQEEKSIQRLEKAGIKIFDRQKEIEVGKSKIKGHIDGLFTLNGVTRLFEHKAWSTMRFMDFNSHGLEYFPGEKAQVNGYLLGLGLDEVDFIVSCKETNNYDDKVYKLDKPFIEETLEWCDKIRLENWKPEPKLCKYCAHCGFDCFGTVFDFSKIANSDAGKMAEQYKKGYMMSKAGEFLIDEAKSYFLGKEDKFGRVLVEPSIDKTKDVIIVEGLRLKRITTHRFDPVKQKILDNFGPEGLMKVCEEKESTYYRFDILD